MMVVIIDSTDTHADLSSLITTLTYMRLTHSLNQSLTHSLNQSLTHSLPELFTHSLTHRQVWFQRFQLAVRTDEASQSIATKKEPSHGKCALILT